MSANGILIVLSSPAEGANEVEFNRWYEEVHAPEIVRRGAAVRYRRYKAAGVPLKEGIPQPAQQYICVYEIEAATVDDVLAIEKQLEDTSDQSAGVSAALDPRSVQAGFFVPVQED